jgi:hypothetical protein
MNEEKQIDFVKDFILKKLVKGYIVGDLKRMLDVKVKPNYDGNINFPIALYTFTSISFLGFLVSKNEFEEDWKRINAHIDLFFTPEDKAEIEPHKTEFTSKYRNGLAHEYFPKMSGISRTNEHLMTLSSKEYWVLDADVLANMFIRSVDNLVKACKDKYFCLQIFNRYNAIQTRNSMFKNKPPISTTTTQNETSSNATSTTLPYNPDEYTTPPQPYHFSKGDTGVCLPDN